MHLISLLDETECDYYLQLDGITVHMANSTVAMLEEFFGDHVIYGDHNIWTSLPQTFVFGR
jgi:hypothetical protein